MVTALTMTYAEEAIGIARAARTAGLPVAISFTVETDGRLPSGQTLTEALAQVDGETEAYPAYYMLNCAHPAHFEDALDDEVVRGRVRGVRPNASMRSHAELDEASTLDEGDPADLATRCAALRAQLPNLNVFGGCCGTDHRHIEAIARAVTP
jgi:S-methylmethionine-dependent homocysteine/selenocysteine methylase